MAAEQFDVLIVGAGLSGIGAAVHLQRDCPSRSYAIMEGRSSIGGTWDLFRYPGIRSDSDMFTLGYSFKPWTQAKAIADGPSILEYVRETAREHDIDRHIRFGHQVVAAAWSSEAARWTVDIELREGENSAVRRTQITCKFLFMCSGYYNYASGYTPEFPGREQFAGPVVHPQFWPEALDYAGKRVVVIGSGATAVTLVPEMAKTAAHVTMLQRSPTYIAGAPDTDRVSDWLRARVSPKLAYGVTRWKNVLFGMAFFNFCRRFPERAKAMLVGGARQALGPAFDVERHFTPSYGPWDQRLCLAPNGDLFGCIRDGAASVVTDHIESLTPTGIRLRSGETLDADIIVTATGLQMQVLSDVAFTVDGAAIDLSRQMTYKGMMISDLPNLAMSMGYTNASWTLKCDLTCEYVCRLLNHMRKQDVDVCVPRLTDPEVQPEPMMDFSSGYVQRAIERFPKQGSKKPWRLHQNYLLDWLALGRGRLEDDAMEFRSTRRDAVRSVAQPAAQLAD